MALASVFWPGNPPQRFGALVCFLGGRGGGCRLLTEVVMMISRHGCLNTKSKYGLGLWHMEKFTSVPVQGLRFGLQTSRTRFNKFAASGPWWPTVTVEVVMHIFTTTNDPAVNNYMPFSPASFLCSYMMCTRQVEAVCFLGLFFWTCAARRSPSVMTTPTYGLETLGLHKHQCSAAAGGCWWFFFSL